MEYKILHNRTRLGKLRESGGRKAMGPKKPGGWKRIARLLRHIGLID